MVAALDWGHHGESLAARRVAGGGIEIGFMKGSAGTTSLGEIETSGKFYLTFRDFSTETQELWLEGVIVGMLNITLGSSFFATQNCTGSTIVRSSSLAYIKGTGEIGWDGAPGSNISTRELTGMTW